MNYWWIVAIVVIVACAAYSCLREFRNADETNNGHWYFDAPISWLFVVAKTAIAAILILSVIAIKGCAGW